MPSLTGTVLGIETSCDETAVSVVQDGKKILSNKISSQIALHRLFGGVVPEIASRKHLEALETILEDALKESGVSLRDVNGIAVTKGPGLIGCLLVGVAFAKGLAFRYGKPFMGVNHIEGHLNAHLLAPEKVSYPHIALVVSGGHTTLFRVKEFGDYVQVGNTRDDAAGEAFDKVAKLLDLGYPGGPVIDRVSEGYDGDLIRFPKPLNRKGNLDFSFSGLKTAVINYIKDNPPGEGDVPKITASFRRTVVDVLVRKTMDAAKKFRCRQIVLAGGVAANSLLRKEFKHISEKGKSRVFLPEMVLCTDNAAMIAAVGARYLAMGKQDELDMNAKAWLPLGMQE